MARLSFTFASTCNIEFTWLSRIISIIFVFIFTNTRASISYIIFFISIRSIFSLRLFSSLKGASFTLVSLRSPWTFSSTLLAAFSCENTSLLLFTLTSLASFSASLSLAGTPGGGLNLTSSYSITMLTSRPNTFSVATQPTYYSFPCIRQLYI